jgi:hypothetical protein
MPKKPARPTRKKDPASTLSGDNPRGEVAACPTALTDPEQAQLPQTAGGAGAPDTGAEETDASEGK